MAGLKQAIEAPRPVEVPLSEQNAGAEDASSAGDVGAGEGEPEER